MGFVAPVVFFSLEFGPSGPLSNATDGSIAESDLYCAKPYVKPKRFSISLIPDQNSNNFATMTSFTS